MHQVAEIPATERVVTEILDDSAAIGVGMGFFDLIFRKAWITLEQKRADLVSPLQVHDLFMGQDGIGGRTTATHEHNEQKRRPMNTEQARPLGYGTWRCRQVAHEFKFGREARE